jgi:hypothetical protein
VIGETRAYPLIHADVSDPERAAQAAGNNVLFTRMNTNQNLGQKAGGLEKLRSRNVLLRFMGGQTEA